MYGSEIVSLSRVVELAVWTVDVAKIPFIELDMFPGAIDLHTRYFMDQFTRLDQCDILPSDMRDNNYGIVDSRCLRFAGATQTAYLHERPRTHIWDSQSPYPKTYDFRGWNVWRCLTLEVAGLIVSIPLDQVFVHSSMCLKHTTCVDRKPVWRILAKLQLIPSHSLSITRQSTRNSRRHASRHQGSPHLSSPSTSTSNIATALPVRHIRRA